MAEEATIFVGSRTLHPGSILRSCRQCGCGVSVTRQGLRRMREYPGRELWCMDCAPKSGEITISDGVLRDISQRLGYFMTRTEVEELVARLDKGQTQE